MDVDNNAIHACVVATVRTTTALGAARYGKRSRWSRSGPPPATSPLLVAVSSSRSAFSALTAPGSRLSFNNDKTGVSRFEGPSFATHQPVKLQAGCPQSHMTAWRPNPRPALLSCLVMSSRRDNRHVTGVAGCWLAGVSNHQQQAATTKHMPCLWLIGVWLSRAPTRQQHKGCRQRKASYKAQKGAIEEGQRR